MWALKLLADLLLMEKVASIRRFYSRSHLINWMNNLPIGISLRVFKETLRASEGMKYVLWRKGRGFKFFK